MCTYKANHNPDLKRHLRVMHPYKRSVFFNQTRRKNTTMTEKANINLNKEELDNQDTNIFEDEKHVNKSNRYYNCNGECSSRDKRFSHQDELDLHVQYFHTFQSGPQ